MPVNLSVPVGYRIGGWEVREPLASGAFASVYAARRVGDDPELPPTAALKFLPTGTRTPRQLRHLRELAEREVALLRRLRRPRLIRMYETLTVDDPDHPELDGATVLVLERADCSLAALLERERTAPSALLAQVCEGLAQLHRAGWVHGDLKPANVLLMPDRTVRLADFNLAAELEGTHAYSPAFSTPDYTPPELLWSEIGERGQRIRPTADIWAFGVLAHLALTGSLPLPGGTPPARRDAALRYARGQEELRLSPELPAGWRDIVTDCLARTHQERAAHNASALLRRVESAAGAERSPRLPRLRPRRVGRYGVLAGSAAALAAAVGLGLFAVRGGDSEPTGYDRCPEGNVCFFTGLDGQGEMCGWFGDYADWFSGDLACDWADERTFRSVFNNGFGTEDGETYVDVAYFREADSVQRVGCVERGAKLNRERTGQTRSHVWVTDC